MRVGVVGWPVAHSRSPTIFGHWFERYGIDATYERIAVPEKDAEAWFEALDGSHFAGVNVTLPHKETAARILPTDAVGKRLGAVNTVWRETGGLRATSSDGAGFVASLDQAVPGWEGPALVIGAGGAAVSVADALVDRGCTVTVANRTAERAERLAETVGATAVPFADMADAMAEAHLLVNATSLGMSGMDPLAIDLGPLPASATVADIVYNPLQTELLAAANARGLAVVDGLGMLLHQATTGFERWFGITPQVDDALRAKVVGTL